MSSPQLSRLSPSQLVSKRQRNENEWVAIMEECETAPSIAAVAANHSERSYSAIYRRFRRMKEGDKAYAHQDRGSHFRIFSDEQEQILAALLRAKRDIDGAILTRPEIIREAADFFRRIHGITALRSSDREFSRGWAEGFKERNGFSTKKLMKKETVKTVNAAEMAVEMEAFKFVVHEAVQCYGADFVLNMDETPFAMAEVRNSSWGDKGSNAPNVSLTTDREKKIMTAMPTVSETGKLLKFAWINKGKTRRGINKLKLPNHIHSFHSPKGWTNEEVMCQYIEQIIFPHTKGRPCALLVDSYLAHGTSIVKEVAEGYGVDLITVPKGQTSTLQPLDVSFNSNFKEKRQKLYSEALRRGGTHLEELGNVVQRTESAYRQVSKDVILAG